MQRLERAFPSRPVNCTSCLHTQCSKRLCKLNVFPPGPSSPPSQRLKCGKIPSPCEHFVSRGISVPEKGQVDPDFRKGNPGYPETRNRRSTEKVAIMVTDSFTAYRPVRKTD